MLKKVLVANRGEIAVRIIRECQENSIETVAVYSTADEQALHTILADRAVCIGGPRPADSYLNINNIIEAARATGCDAVHPGFGFLSERSDFARACQENGLKFIGPSADVIDTMGNKARARQLMLDWGVPVVPGSAGMVPDEETAVAEAERIGYPVLLKAAAGGGGRGMRRAFHAEEVRQGFRAASAEAESCFGDGSMYVEKLIQNPRHIEVQILADSKGSVIHLGERDCSIQRRNQKMLEESPAPGITPPLRKALGEAAVKAAKACNYESAGTVEFVVDQENHFYFIEMNTRIQVEHPVTEMVTGVNIVKEQLRIASGLPLAVSQDQVQLKGHAIECRITAEDAKDGFRPSPGKLEFIHFPAGSGVRVDSALYNGCEVSPYYDSMVAKVIVHSGTRLEAIRKMRRALSEMVITGVETTLPVQHLLLFHPEFLRGGCDTGFMDRNLSDLLTACERVDKINESI